MTEWEAKYKALLAGITDQECVTNATRLVETSIRLSATSTLTFEQIFYALLHAAGLLEVKLEAE